MSNEVSIPLYDAVYDYIEQSYKEQAADQNIEWTQGHNEFVEAEVAGLYGQVSQAVEMYMMHLASPLPDFSEDDNDK